MMPVSSARTFLARLDDRAKNIRVLPIVVSELEFFDVQRQVLRADLVERADDPALHETPEALDGIGVNRAVDVFASAVMHHPDRVLEAEFAVSGVLVSAEKADLVRHGFADKG